MKLTSPNSGANVNIGDEIIYNFEIENTLLKNRGLKTMKDIDEYHGKFTFPIIKFYEKMGFSVCSDVFMEADIPHVEMRLLLGK